MITVFDVPPLAPFFFVDLDYTTDEAQEMRASVSTDDYRELLICSYQNQLMRIKDLLSKRQHVSLTNDWMKKSRTLRK